MTAWPLTRLPKFDVTFPWRGSNFVPFNMMDARTPDSARLEVRNHCSPLALSPRRPLSWTSTWQTMSRRKGNGDWKFALCIWLCTESSVLPFLLQKHRAQDASSRYKVQVNSNVYFLKIMAIFSVKAYCLLRTQKHLWSVYRGSTLQERVIF